MSNEAAAGAPLGKLVVVTMEKPWPPNHGGRVDQWNRWTVMRSLGWDLTLVTWDDAGAVGEEEAAALSQVFSRTFVFPSSRRLGALVRRLVMLWRHSPHISSRALTRKAARSLVAQLEASRPDAVVLDGIYGSLAASEVATSLNVPLVYRAHNVEHVYMRKQARAARGLKSKLTLILASLNLKRAEVEAHRQARWTFDISVDDIAFWMRNGFTRSSWLPPMVSYKSIENPTAWRDREFDIVYLGNLNTPNNVEGIVWFLEEILPEILRNEPGVKVLLAGSNPSNLVQSLIKDSANVELEENPPDALKVRQKGRVLVNPILAGSGVNVKSVEMLFTDSPVVTTSIGVQGLAQDVRQAFHISDTAEGFAGLVTEALRSGAIDAAVRSAARNYFGVEAGQNLSLAMLAVLRGAK